MVTVTALKFKMLIKWCNSSLRACSLPKEKGLAALYHQTYAKSSDTLKVHVRTAYAGFVMCQN